MMDVLELRRFESLIRVRSGLNMRVQEMDLLRQTLKSRTQALGFSTSAHYLDLLDSDSPDAQHEWKHLFGLLTNQESYFFRDPGQLAVIRDHLLPELIRLRRDRRTLRIWSAGCSTGEEPYSLAMMLHDLLPSHEGWRVLVLGTDLSESALERARRGLYGSWSFRARDSDIQERFFLPRGNKWEVKPSVRQFVKFAHGNLLHDEFPTRMSEMHDMDLIVCRNVFIYFARDAVARVLQKFHATLQPEGYLVTGHAELHDAPLGNLQLRSFPETVAYQRVANSHTVAPRELRLSPPIAPNIKAAPVAAVAAPSAPRQSAPLPSSPIRNSVPPQVLADAVDTIAEATKMIRAGRYEAALKCLHSLLQREPRNIAALCLAAQAHANRGQLDEAEANCRRVIELSSFAPLPYHLLARTASERGDNEAAKSLLKKVIYLNPSSVGSYLELVDLYAGEGDSKRARQMQRSALEILAGLSEDALVPIDEFSAEERLTVAELKRHLQSNISD